MEDLGLGILPGHVMIARLPKIVASIHYVPPSRRQGRSRERLASVEDNDARRECPLLDSRSGVGIVGRNLPAMRQASPMVLASHIPLTRYDLVNRAIVPFPDPDRI